MLAQQPISTYRAPLRFQETPSWLLNLAQQSEDTIRAANRGGWPSTMQQLRKVAKEIGGWLVRIDPQSSTLFPGVCFDGLIIVGETGREISNMGNILHEIVEANLRTEGVPLNSPGDYLTPHDVACLVQEDFETYLLFSRAGEELCTAQKRKRAIKVDGSQQILQYERDENADAPFWDGAE